MLKSLSGHYVTFESSVASQLLWASISTAVLWAELEVPGEVCGLQIHMEHCGLAEERLHYVGTTSLFPFYLYYWQSSLQLCSLQLHGSGNKLLAQV